MNHVQSKATLVRSSHVNQQVAVVITWMEGSAQRYAFQVYGINGGTGHTFYQADQLCESQAEAIGLFEDWHEALGFERAD